MLGLFGTRRTKPETCEEVAEMIERNFKRRRLDVNAHGLEGCEGYGWNFKEGSAVIYVFVQDEEDGPVIRVTSPIVHFPQSNREAFFHRLLEINRDLNAICLAAFQEVVLVSGQRDIRGLDDDELEHLIWYVARVADDLDGKLAAEFGALPYLDN